MFSDIVIVIVFCSLRIPEVDSRVGLGMQLSVWSTLCELSLDSPAARVSRSPPGAEPSRQDLNWARIHQGSPGRHDLRALFRAPFFVRPLAREHSIVKRSQSCTQAHARPTMHARIHIALFSPFR